MNEPRINVVQMAGMLARDPLFIDWVGQWTVPPRAVSAEEAAQFIRHVCQVESRRELLTNRDAEQRFHNFIRKPYLLWKERNLENV